VEFQLKSVKSRRLSIFTAAAFRQLSGRTGLVVSVEAETPAPTCPSSTLSTIAGIPRHRHRHRHSRRHPREDRRENVGLPVVQLATGITSESLTCRTCRRGSLRGCPCRCRRHGMPAYAQSLTHSPTLQLLHTCTSAHISWSVFEARITSVELRHSSDHCARRRPPGTNSFQERSYNKSQRSSPRLL